MVASAEEDDCAGQRGNSSFTARHQTADGNHHRSYQADGDGKDREDAVLQSGEKDGGAGVGVLHWQDR